jgi:hypothetical protein
MHEGSVAEGSKDHAQHHNEPNEQGEEPLSRGVREPCSHKRVPLGTLESTIPSPQRHFYAHSCPGRDKLGHKNGMECATVLSDKIKAFPNTNALQCNVQALCVGEMVARDRKDGKREGGWERRDRIMGRDSWDLLSQGLKNRWKRSEEAAGREKEEHQAFDCHHRLQSWRVNRRDDLLCVFDEKGCMVILYPSVVGDAGAQC